MKGEDTCKAFNKSSAKKLENELIVLMHVAGTQMQKNSVLTH